MDTFNSSVLESAVSGQSGQLPRCRVRSAACSPVFRQVAHPSSRAAFTLVEIALALGIMAFAFVAILGLVPLGMTSFREAKAAGVSSQISQQIIAQVQVAPFSTLTQSSGFHYFTDQGLEVLSTDSTWIYQVNTRILVGPPFVQSGAAAAVTNADLAALTIQVAYNPGRLTLDIDQNTNLWKGTSNGTTTVPIVAFQTNVARNFFQ